MLVLVALVLFCCAFLLCAWARLLAPRLRVIVPAGVWMGLVGFVLSGISLHSFFNDPTLRMAVSFGVAVLLAPLFLVGESWRQGDGAFPVETLTLAIVAMVATPTHPAIPCKGTTVVTVMGTVAWLLCQLLVAGAPA